MPSGFDWSSWTLAAGQTCYDSTIYIANDAIISKEVTFPYQPYNNGLAEIDVSRDGGQTVVPSFVWGPLGEITGVVTTSRHAAFFGTVDQGIFRTTNQGRTWVNIGGPTGVMLTRHIAAVNDNIIFAVDTDGVLWETTNCGGQPIKPPKPPMPYVQSISFAPVSACSNGNVDTALIAHQFCHPLIVTGAKIEGGDSGYFSLGAITFPDTLGDGRVLKFPVSFSPHNQPSSFSTNIRVRGVIYDDDDEDTLYIDTLIHVSASSKPNGPNLESKLSLLQFDTLSTCSTYQDTTITLTNAGCDTLRIISGPNGLIPEFTLISPLTLPVVLPKDSSLTLHFRFKPSGSGNFITTVSFRDSQQTLTDKISFTLEGTGIKEGGVFAYSPQVFDFKSLSICDSSTLSGWIANTGCDSLSLDSSRYFGDPDFHSTLGTEHIALAPGDTTRYALHLNPVKKGIRTGYLVLTETDVNGTKRDSVAVTVTVTKGTSILSSSLSTIDFGTTSVCEERDSFIVLHNSGCYDSVVVTGISGQLTGFSVDTTFPVYIPPNGSIRIPIHTTVDTTGGSTSNSQTLTFTYQADNTIAPIALSRSYRYPQTITLHLTGTRQGYNQQEADFTLTSDKLVRGIGEIDFTLSYNSDLLTYKSNSSGYQVTTTDGRHFRIIFTNPITPSSDTTLATLKFIVFLTKDSTTAINVSNVTLNGASGAPLANCIASITTASSDFTYLYQCGEQTIHDFMNDRPIRITSIKPNPGQENETIEIASSVAQDATVEIVNALGAIIAKRSDALRTGTNTIMMDTHELASGIYVIRVHGNSFDVSGSFVKEQ